MKTKEGKRELWPIMGPVIPQIYQAMATTAFGAACAIVIFVRNGISRY